MHNVIKVNNRINKIRFIDLFAGIGGTRIGFEQACIELNLIPQCVFSSEIKDHAILVYKNNFSNSEVKGDITKINPANIPDFEYLLAGFPCQPFSTAGNRNGFLDKRGGLFFTIHQILKIKKPQGFLLENVEGLVNHDNGKTFEFMITQLVELGYQVAWKILDASQFGVPQKRKRVYIVGHNQYKPILENFNYSFKAAGEFIDYNAPVALSEFTALLFQKFSIDSLYGKSIKDKRGGANNIHSWDLEIKGKVTAEQKELLELLLKKRRYKKWAKEKGIDWMDGMPLTLDEIKTFYNNAHLEQNLIDLVYKGYLRFEHPKKKIIVNGISKRVFNTDALKGYNIVSGKLSFPLSYIINPAGVSPTIVATEVGKIGIVTSKGIRPITIREGLSFSGFPQNYTINGIEYNKAFDLIGNTVIPPVIKEVALKFFN